ncbi:MAG: imidazoleglycerol-phosphate dehydratase HisB [Desulfobulbaceae bacterium]|nr:imidazoleglycerol-phosphate dehydratase HisB [Desulfobulbaceae bacterium]
MSESQLRKSEVRRCTKETDIKIELSLDGGGVYEIDTGVGFIDHMLILFAVHGRFDLIIKAKGDTEIDDHHTVEDLGICLGQAFKRALGDMSSIARYGHAYVPMDETLARVCVDVSNRPYLHYNVEVPDQKVGNFDTALAKEFLRGLMLNAGLTLHVDLLHGENSHHILEAVFKALGRALSAAVTRDAGIIGTLSSKGVI